MCSTFTRLEGNNPSGLQSSVQCVAHLPVWREITERFAEQCTVCSTFTRLVGNKQSGVPSAAQVGRHSEFAKELNITIYRILYHRWFLELYS